MKSIVWFSSIASLLFTGGVLASPADCENFRCRFGDVADRSPPLVAEPFHAFYSDAVVRPLTPYRSVIEPVRLESKPAMGSGKSSTEDAPMEQNGG